MNTKYKVLNRDVIKYIAMLTMLLNHISTIFMKSGSFLSEFFLDIGYFTAITMCFFLVEGYQYTHSQKAYALRLLLFALISEVPYCLAFTQVGIIEFEGLNMMFTLLFIWSKGSDKKIKLSFIIAVLLFAAFNLAGGIGRFSMTTNILYALGSMVGTGLSGIVIAYLYNGKRMEKGRVFSKWFFYWFYPVHLLILGLIRIFM